MVPNSDYTPGVDNFIQKLFSWGSVVKWFWEVDVATLSKETAPMIKDTEVPDKHNTIYSSLCWAYNEDSSHAYGALVTNLCPGPGANHA